MPYLRIASATLTDGILFSSARAFNAATVTKWAIDLEERSQSLSVIRAAKAVRSQDPVAAGHIRTDLFGKELHVIGRRDNGAVSKFGKPFRNVRRARRFGRVQHVPAFDVARLAGKFRETGDTPDCRRIADLSQAARPRHDFLRIAPEPEAEPYGGQRLWVLARRRYMPRTMPSSTPRGIRRVFVAFIQKRQIEEDVFLVRSHALQAVARRSTATS